MRAIHICHILKRACLLGASFSLFVVHLYGQLYPVNSSVSTDNPVEWRDNRARLRLEEPGRLRVGPPAGYTDTSTSTEDKSKDAEKKEESNKEETASTLSAFYLSTLASTDQVTMAPVVGGVPIYGGGLPRMYAPGYRLMGLDVAADLGVSTLYNDNIYLRSGKDGQKREGDFISVISPHISFSTDNAADTVFNLSVSPSLLLFQDHTGQNTANNDSTLSITRKFSKTSIFLSQTYSSVTGGTLESGDLMSNDWYITNGGVRYEISPKLSMEVSDKLIVRTYKSGYDSIDNMVSVWLNYAYSEKLILGVGPSYGVVDTDGGANQQYQRGSVRTTYLLGEKTSLFAQAGIDRREYQSSDLERYDMVFSGGSTWDISAKSKVTTQVNRRIQASNAYQNQDVTITGVSATYTQGIVKGLSSSLSAGYDHSEYASSVASTASEREDDYFTLSPGVRWSVLEWWDVSGTYLYRRNFSNFSNSEFDNNVFTLSSTVRF